MWEETHRLSSTCCTGEEGLLGSLERKVGRGGQRQGTKGNVAKGSDAGRGNRRCLGPLPTTVL